MGGGFLKKTEKIPNLFGVFKSNCNTLCPDQDGFVADEIGSWPYTALTCTIEKYEI